MQAQIAGENSKSKKHILILLNNLLEAIHEPPILIPPGEKTTRKIAMP
jgi:hypothetical protein